MAAPTEADINLSANPVLAGGYARSINTAERFFRRRPFRPGQDRARRAWERHEKIGPPPLRRLRIRRPSVLPADDHTSGATCSRARELRGCPASSAGRRHKASLPQEKQSHPSCDWLTRPVSEQTAIPVWWRAHHLRGRPVFWAAPPKGSSPLRGFLHAHLVTSPRRIRRDQLSRLSGDTSIRSGRCCSSRHMTRAFLSVVNIFYPFIFIIALACECQQKSTIITATDPGVAAVICKTEASGPHPARLQQQLHFVAATGASGKSSCRVRLSVEPHSPSPSHCCYEGDPIWKVSF